MSRIDELKSLIENCKKTIESSEKEIEMLKAKKPAFERVKKGERYYSVGKASTGESVSYLVVEEGMTYNENYFKNNNYFHTKERAEEVADKINFLLKLERLHDIYCPDYKPNWNDKFKVKWAAAFDYNKGKYAPFYNTTLDDHTIVYFDNKETACKVCDVLNKEVGNE